MATLTTHILDSVTGKHAAGVSVALYRVAASGERTLLLDAVTDDGGRLRETVPLGSTDGGVTCELVVQVADYFAGNGSEPTSDSVLREAVFRFAIPQPEGAYHIPMMLAPSSYSVWFAAA